jgi:FkbM family methyltransferase
MSFLSDFAQKTGLHKRASRYLRKLNYSRRISINGAEVFIPHIRGIACPYTEPWMTGLLDKLLKEQPGAILDVGVNVGQTLIKVKALDRQRQYIGFEPNPVCVFYVQELIKRNQFQNCTLIPVGLFTEDTVMALDLFSHDVADSAASLIDNFRPRDQVHSRVFVPVFRFDGLAKLVGNHTIGLVKIDVEGAENEVIKSLLNLIRRDKPLILVEILPVYQSTNAFRIERQDELERMFAEVGYSILRVQKTSDNKFAGFKRIDKIEVHSDIDLCDYVIAPNERLERLQIA